MGSGIGGFFHENFVFVLFLILILLVLGGDK